MDTGTPVRPEQQQTSNGAQQKAQEALGQSQDRVQEAASQAKSRLRDQLDQRSSQAGEQIHQQASDLRAISMSLREQGKEGPANASDKLAQYATKAGTYLQHKDSEALLSDAEDFARRQPWAVGAGALVVGFAASRFLKASSSRRYSARYGRAHAPEPRSARPAVMPPSGPGSAGLETFSPAGGGYAADIATPPGTPVAGRTPEA